MIISYLKDNHVPYPDKLTYTGWEGTPNNLAIQPKDSVKFDYVYPRTVQSMPEPSQQCVQSLSLGSPMEATRSSSRW